MKQLVRNCIVPQSQPAFSCPHFCLQVLRAFISGHVEHQQVTFWKSLQRSLIVFSPVGRYVEPALAATCQDTCEEYGAALLVDFEGEMPGSADPQRATHISARSARTDPTLCHCRPWWRGEHRASAVHAGRVVGDQRLAEINMSPCQSCPRPSRCVAESYD